jgi:hypothetical protein
VNLHLQHALKAERSKNGPPPIRKEVCSNTSPLRTKDEASNTSPERSNVVSVDFSHRSNSVNTESTKAIGGTREPPRDTVPGTPSPEKIHDDTKKEDPVTNPSQDNYSGNTYKKGTMENYKGDAMDKLEFPEGIPPKGHSHFTG